ncbi:UvrD-helicase domain-containing protein [Actinomyces sp. zg-332]|uniref:ATP-dependent helicase n=1 Tax=Actinomyces sp. zg-332 TaxID=2708340 RepID=UPI00141DD2E8|nr:UvrD-helicase domain-containing protein [Actinomyces sp. zg-332]QPK93846.1 UvrD-helicase domain-containing protein [Actinomyces sp. zg-332]
MDLLQDLNAEQRKAVCYSGKYLLVVAGAGSGKTRVLTRRIAHILEEKLLSPNEILAITFTNKAAKEMRERVADLIGSDLESMWICTFHSMCVRILRMEHSLLGINSAFSIYDTIDVKKLIKNIYLAQNISTTTYPIKETITQISDWKNNLIDSQTALEEAEENESNKIIAQIYVEYQNQLRAASAFDFDDLLSETVYLFKNFPEIAEKYHNRFKHILVDEYQDTNYAQYVLVKSIVEGAEGSEETNSYLTVVGDSDQSIYAFRGATIRNIEEFERDFTNAECILLEQNYRSTGNILQAANSVISQNIGRREKNLWSANGNGDKITIYVGDSEYEESYYISQRIQELLLEGYKGSDIAIFYRTNSQSGPLEAELAKSTIAYTIVGGTKFYDRKEIKDALAYLHLIANPDDITNFLRIVNEPKRGIGPKAQNTIIEVAKENKIGIGDVLDSLFGYVLEKYEGVKLTKVAQKNLCDFWESIKKCKNLDKEAGKSAQILTEILEKTDYLPTLRSSKDVQDQARVENLTQFQSIIEEFIKEYPQAHLTDFLENVSLMTDLDNVSQENTGEVTLMTVHTSKGLEFPVVFITGMEEEIFPHQLSFDEEDGIEEERRLAYVAITRAREKLFLTRANRRNIWNTYKHNQPSRFLEDIPENTYVLKDERTYRHDEENGYGIFSNSQRQARWKDNYDSDYKDKYEWKNTLTLEDYTTYKIGEKSNKGFIGKIGVKKNVTVPDKNDVNSFGNENKTVKIQEYDFEIGDKVRHKTFGDGIITGFEEQKVNSTVTVKFKNGSVKKLLLRFKPLTKIEE